MLWSLDRGRTAVQSSARAPQPKDQSEQTQVTIQRDQGQGIKPPPPRKLATAHPAMPTLSTNQSRPTPTSSRRGTREHHPPQPKPHHQKKRNQPDRHLVEISLKARQRCPRGRWYAVINTGQSKANATPSRHQNTNTDSPLSSRNLVTPIRSLPSECQGVSVDQKHLQNTTNETDATRHARTSRHG